MKSLKFSFEETRSETDAICGVLVCNAMKLGGKKDTEPSRIVREGMRTSENQT